jgi:hypothetical protein
MLGVFLAELVGIWAMFVSPDPFIQIVAGGCILAGLLGGFLALIVEELHR